jgi:hypothetical protein
MEERGEEDINLWLEWKMRASNWANEGGIAFLTSEKQEDEFGQVNELKGKWTLTK